MQGQFEDLLKDSQLEENSRLFQEKLEGIRREKEEIMTEDEIIEREKKKSPPTSEQQQRVDM